MINPSLIARRMCLCFAIIVYDKIAIAAEPFQKSSSQDPIPTVTETDRSTIKRSNDPVWFDSTDGAVRPTLQGKSIDVEDRHDSIAVPRGKANPSWWSALLKNIQGLISWLLTGWPVWLVVAFMAIVTIIAYLILSYLPEARRRQSSGLSRVEKEKGKIQDLPFEVEQSMLGLLSQAERCRAAGDFSKAIVYLFSYALVEMDSARCIRLQRGKTNRVYLRELSDREKLRSFTSQVILAFEYAFFGKHVLSQESFERIWQQLPAFEADLKQSASLGSEIPLGRS